MRRAKLVAREAFTAFVVMATTLAAFVAITLLLDRLDP